MFIIQANLKSMGQWLYNTLPRSIGFSFSFTHGVISYLYSLAPSFSLIDLKVIVLEVFRCKFYFPIKIKTVKIISACMWSASSINCSLIRACLG